MLKKLRGYKILGQSWATNTSRLYKARRGRGRYVVKEYTKYRFLSEESRKDASPRLLEADRRAQAFLEHLQRVSGLMQRECRANGLLNIPLEVFRQDVFIYKITRMVEAVNTDPFQLRSCATRQQMDIFLKTVLVQLDLLRRIGFVHGDIKPENLLITRREECYSAVMIDYEGGIVLGAGWDGHDIEYTPEYASPEMLHFQSLRYGGRQEEIQDAYQKLGCAADIFSAGCAFAGLLAGSALGGCGGDAAMIVPAERLRTDTPLWIPRFHPFWRMLVKEMLRYEPGERPTAEELLGALRAGEEAGLLEQLESPFGQLEGYGFGDAPVESFGGQQMRVGTRLEGQGQYAVWHLDNAWDAKPPHASKRGLLARQGSAAQRRRKYLSSVLERLNGCQPVPEPMVCGELAGQGALCFLAQRLPEGDRLTVEAFAKSRPSREEAKRIMLELLDLAGRLHETGLLGCAMAKEDVWIVAGSGGDAHPFLARPQRLLLMGQIPDPADIDLSAEILAPELCMYLGCQDRKRRRALAEMVGTQSDIFSLGLVYHLLLCGELPAMAKPELAYLGLAAEQDASGRSGLLFSGEIGPEEQAVLRKMTAFEPDERVGSCGVAAAMLRGEIAAEELAPAAQQATLPGREGGCQRQEAGGEEPGGLIDLSEDAGGQEEGETLSLGGSGQGEHSAVPELEEVSEPVLPPGGVREGKWHVWTDSRTGEDKLIRRSLGLEAGKGPLNAIHRLARANGTLVDIERRVRHKGEWYAVADVPPEAGRCLADRGGGVAPEEADAILLPMLLAVETLHKKGAVCAAVRPEDILATPEGIRFDPYENGLFLDAPDTGARWAARVGKDWRHLEQLERWMAPEMRSVLESPDAKVSEECDVYSLGLLYHWLLLGRLPEREELYLPSLDGTISFGRRWMLSQMLSKKRIPLGGAVTMLRQLIGLRGQAYAFGAEQFRNEKAALYAKAYGREIFVAEAETDGSGNAAFYGGLPELEYLIRCKGEAVGCSLRSGRPEWISPGTFVSPLAKK